MLLAATLTALIGRRCDLFTER